MRELKGLDWLAQQEYLGRGILLGRTFNGSGVISYFVTGRSESSRARRLIEEWDDDCVRTAPTNEEDLKKGNPALLIYNAMSKISSQIYAVSNGVQTDIISQAVTRTGSDSPAVVLADAFSKPFVLDGIDLTSYEPDKPNYTPRISGLLIKGKGALAIVRNNSGNPERSYFEFSPIPEHGKFISTYSGRNVKKGEVIPCFAGEPIDFLIPGNSAEEITKNIYNALGPKQQGVGGQEIVSPGEDFRVGVSSILFEFEDDAIVPIDDPVWSSSYTINRHDLEKK